MGEMKELTDSKIDNAITDFLSNFPFFSDLKEDQLEIISDYINFIEIGEGKVLFSEGDKGDCMYFVIDGELDIIKESVSGGKIGIDKVVIATLSKGSSIGEMSIIDDISRSATVSTRTKATLVSFTRKGFSLILENQPEIGAKILIGLSRLLSKSLRKTSGRLADYTLAKIPRNKVEIKGA